MTSERWRQVDQLFHSALEREPEERAAFLDEACSGDAELRLEIESLVEADAATEHTTKALPAQIAAEMLATEGGRIAAGQQIGHYRVLAPLGAGGMGEVFLAQDTRLGRKIALKLLPARFTQDAERVRRFEQEARAASALNHPNIITIHEIGQTAGLHYLIIEYIEGEVLRRQIARARMSLLEALDVALQVAIALQAAHTAGVIHRDIKPENIMRRPDGLVKVLDFGLAKLAGSQKSEVGTRNEEEQFPSDIHRSSFREHTSTMPGIVMGTVAYMSPEQARGLKVDARTDIFSLGVMLYEMIAGRPPFAGATPSDVMAAILRDEPPSLSMQFPECPATMERIVKRCLAKSPDERYQTATALAAELKAARAALEEDSHPTKAMATEKARDEITQTLRRPRQSWMVMGGVVALLTLLVALYYFRNGRDTAAAIKTLAVLPPRPLQAGARDEALELGTTSILITRLSNLRQLIVRPESAVERYARPDQDPLAAGREQKVDAVFDSRYQRSGDKFRFTLRLLRVADGATLWADTLDQQTADLFAIQDALSSKVTSALKLTLSSAEKERLAKRDTNSAEAWLLYVRGRVLVHTRRIPNIEKAITYYERAISLDPDFALAHAQLGHAYASLSYVGHSPAKEVMPKAKIAYDQAMKLDDQLAETHAYLAQYQHYYEWDFVGAEAGHKRSIELNPNSADVRHAYAFYLTYMGRFERAIPEIRKAEELDPTSTWFGRNVAQVLFFARRYDEAIEQSRRVIDLNPNSGAVYAWIIRALEMKGDDQIAFAAYLKRAEANEAGPDEIVEMKAAFASGGLKGYRRWELDRRLKREKSGYVPQLSIAALYAELGEKEQVLARLQWAVEDRNLYVVALNVDPLWDSYRSDPRFMALVQRVGLAP
jgi:eukaryotic-like serine/threonine-protein kinase